jgi:hypothetical protein
MMRTPRQIDVTLDVVAHCASCHERIYNRPNERAYCASCVDEQRAHIAQLQHQINLLGDSDVCEDCYATRRDLLNIANALVSVSNALYHEHNVRERTLEMLDDIAARVAALAYAIDSR